MRRFPSIAIVLVATVGACAAFYNPSDPYYIRMHKATFAGKKPREIARFLAHPDTLTQKGAVAALADTPDDALPLVEKLLTDQNAWIRAGAVDVLAQMVRKDGAGTTKTRAVQLLQRYLAEEESAQVLYSICKLFMALDFDPDVMTPFIARAARSEHPDTRKAAMWLFIGRQTNPEEMVRTAMAIMESSQLRINEDALAVTILLDRAKSHDAVRASIPAIAGHLRNRVNSARPPFRKQAWYQALDRELSVLEAQWDAGVEQMPDVVPALCRAVVRLPRGKTNSGNLHRRAKRLLERCRAVSAVTIRACAREEALWLAAVTDRDLLRILNGFSAKRLNGDEARSACRDEIKYLGSLADGLEGR